MKIRRHLVLVLNATGHILTRVDITGSTGLQDLQLRQDLAKAYDVYDGEARFDVMEGPQGDMVRIDQLQVPRF